MANTIRTSDARDIEIPLSDNAASRTASRSNTNTSDEMIVTLANAYENKRARQVTEWERAQSVYVRNTV
jgi:hypothetical protein